MTFEDVLLWVVCGIAVLSVVVAQLLSVALFDSTGLDRIVPHLVATTLLPALTVAVIPGVYAKYRYGRTMAGIVGGLVFAAALALSSWTVLFYDLCGPC